MRLKTTIKNIPFKLSDHKFCDGGGQHHELKQNEVLFQDPEYGSIEVKQTIVGSYLITFLKINLTQPVDIETFSDELATQMFFFMKGPTNLMHHQIRSLNTGTSVANFPAAVSEYEYLTITIPEKTFKSLVDPLDLDIDFTMQSCDKCTEDLFKQCEIMSPEILSVVRDIAMCERTGHYRRMYLEAKISELLLLQIEQLIHSQNAPISIPQVDINRMHQARELITQSFATPCSLIDLARKVGTNEFKLKKYFKQMFGTTVYGYVTELKMRKAKQILQQDELSVYQVAESLGFKSSNHFSTAFRKFHGFTPSEIKKQSSYLDSKIPVE